MKKQLIDLKYKIACKINRIKIIKFKGSKTFKFRIKYIISRNSQISGLQKEVKTFLLNGHTISLLCIDNTDFNNSKTFTLTSGGYSTEGEAYKVALQIKSAVLLYGVKNRLGIDIGKDKANGGFSEYFRNKLLDETGINYINDIHGIIIISEEFPISICSVGSPCIMLPRTSECFLNEVNQITTLNRELNKRTLLAIELFLSSFFEVSKKARFLSLVLSLESMLEPENRTEETRNLVDVIYQMVSSSSIDKTTKESLLGSLRWLYKDSISRTLKKWQ